MKTRMFLSVFGVLMLLASIKPGIAEAADKPNGEPFKAIWEAINNLQNQINGIRGGWTDDGNVVRLTNAADSVGIGTASPTGQLEVVGSAVITNSADSHLTIQSLGTSDKDAEINLDNNDVRWKIANDDGADSNLHIYRHMRNSDGSFDPSYNSVMLLDKNGNVGVGTAAPQHKLDVEGYIQAHGYYTGDIIFQKGGKKLWKMFEDENGLYLKSLKTGKVYKFSLQEIHEK